MEIIKKEIFLENNSLSLIDSQTLFFDIETLGLSSKYNPIYLIGIFTVIENSGLITLIFANNKVKTKRKVMKR